MSATANVSKSVFQSRLTSFIGAVCLSLAYVAAAAGEDNAMVYRVPKFSSPIAVEADWDAPAWSRVHAVELKHFMGSRPSHFPDVRAKVGYDEDSIYVIFQVKDQYVRAVSERHQGAVFRDSCVEFFFTPSADVDNGYFNLEMNCGGTMLFHFQRAPRTDSHVMRREEIQTVEVAHTLPKIVEPEIATPTEWCVSYRIPFTLIKSRFPGEFTKPSTGVQWRANFYKCGDATSHPHWLTWSPIDFPRPDFHRPNSFGFLEFE